jgi:hypothetical protein
MTMTVVVTPALRQSGGNCSRTCPTLEATDEGRHSHCHVASPALPPLFAQLAALLHSLQATHSLTLCGQSQIGRVNVDRLGQNMGPHLLRTGTS